MADWRSLRTRLADTEARMCAVLDELDLTGLVTSNNRRACLIICVRGCR
jgi:hypothetical protein